MEFYKKCRICLLEMRNNGKEITCQIQKEFFYLTNEELEEFEQYSTKICDDCFSELQKSCKFKAFCLENQKRLRESFVEQSIEKFENPLILDFIKAEPTLEIPPVFVETHPEINPKTEEPDSDQEREKLINYYLNLATSQKAIKPVKVKKPKIRKIQPKKIKKPTETIPQLDPQE